MIKILFRIVMILLAAGIVAGGLYIYAANTDSNTGIVDSRGGDFAEGQGIPAGGEFSGKQFEGSGPGDSGMGRGHEGGDAGSLRGWLGILTQLGKIAFITAIIAGFQVLIKLVRRNRKRKAMTSGAA